MAQVQFKKDFEKRYQILLGSRFEEFKKYSLKFLRRAVRFNTLISDIKKTKNSLIEKSWTFSPIPWCEQGYWIDHKEGRRDIGNTKEHALGKIYVQSAASMIPPIALDPKPGEIVLDMCASPGSKSTQIAQYMQNNGLLVCNEISAKRIAPLSINLQRCNVMNSIVTKMNGKRFGKFNNMFDKVLVDAPCSGMGSISKSYKIIEMWNPNMIKRLAGTQKQLITSGFSALKPKGTLVYSTCTLEPEENEGVIDFLLEEFDNAKVEEINLNIKKSKPILQFEGTQYNKKINKALRIWPQDNDTEGFFVCKITKICGEESP